MQSIIAKLNLATVVEDCQAAEAIELHALARSASERVRTAAKDLLTELRMERAIMLAGIHAETIPRLEKTARQIVVCDVCGRSHQEETFCVCQSPDRNDEDEVIASTFDQDERRYMELLNRTFNA